MESTSANNVCINQQKYNRDGLRSGREPLLPMQETKEMWAQPLGQEETWEEEMATHSTVLAWKIPWTEKPGRLQTTGLQRVRHD